MSLYALVVCIFICIFLVVSIVFGIFDSIDDCMRRITPFGLVFLAIIVAAGEFFVVLAIEKAFPVKVYEKEITADEYTKLQESVANDQNIKAIAKQKMADGKITTTEKQEIENAILIQIQQNEKEQLKAAASNFRTFLDIPEPNETFLIKVD